MIVDQTVAVAVKPDVAWAVLMDIPTVSQCVPGVESVAPAGDTTWTGVIGIKVGPIGVRLEGKVTVAERDDAARTARFDIEATDRRIRGAVNAKTTLSLRELPDAVPRWGSWVLHDRPPVAGPEQMARRRVALLGDAAHPMRPYLAQGAAMAIEDAFELGRVLSAVDGAVIDVSAALARYALNRWERCARVQRRSLRNAGIFHASGLKRLARDAALRAMGRRLMDVPWLYGP